MAPNIVPTAFCPETVTENSVAKEQYPPAPAPKINYYIHIFQSTLNLIAHILIGFVVSISFLFAVKNGLPLPFGPTPTHIILCVMGFQLLMAESFLCLSSGNAWSSRLRLVDKYRAHWILQILGAGMTLAGTIVKALDKEVNWNTYHGQFGLVALVFTIASLFNGLTTLYAYQFRKYLNGTFSRLTHICFGVIAFAASGISLCFGFNYERFRIWATNEFADTIIALTAIFTFIVMINPCITFYKKTLVAVQN